MVNNIGLLASTTGFIVYDFDTKQTIAQQSTSGYFGSFNVDAQDGYFLYSQSVLASTSLWMFDLNSKTNKKIIDSEVWGYAGAIFFAGLLTVIKVPKVLAMAE